MKRVSDHPSGLYWEEPSETRGGNKSKYAERLDVMRGHPMRWAVIGTFTNRDAANAALRYIRDEAKYVERGEFELTTRKSGTVWKLYARYLKGENDGAQ